MLEGKKILAVVPARGGSKGVPLKNLRPLKGIPLVAYGALLIKNISVIDRAIVSTDHEEIAQAAEKAGLAAPFRRPPDLSGDRIGDWDVLAHALQEMEKQDRTKYDIVLMLQPTSPLRKREHVLGTLDLLLKGGYDSVWTVSETSNKFHPLKALTIKGGAMSYLDPRGSSIIARQQLEPVYHRNGVAYAMTRDCLLDQKSIMGKKSGAFVITDPLINIDTVEDFAVAENFL